ncbi:MAG: hypothetical protein IKP73_02995 [Bacteroidales bacterium]|nr:hypothetical protein [Bacteroidales bacterium]
MPNIDILSPAKIASMQIYSNYAATKIFDIVIISDMNNILYSSVDSIILFSSTQSEKEEAIGNVKKYNKKTNNNVVLLINPSDYAIKRSIFAHNKIGIFKGKNTPTRIIDNLYYNIKIKSNNILNKYTEFIDNTELMLFSHKINHLYNQFKCIVKNEEIIMQRIFEEIKNELKEAKDTDTYKYVALERLVNNFDYVVSVITICGDSDKSELQFDEDKNINEPHTYSNMPKGRLLKGILSSFTNGKVDELGTPLYYDSMVINNILTRTISGSKDSNDMIGRLKSAQRYNKWMDKLIENINSDTTGRLKSILFTKYANLYAAKYVTINGNRIIDESSDFATTSINVGVVSEMDEKRSPFSKEITDATCDNIARGLQMGGSLRKLPDGNPYREQYKQYLDDNNSRLVFYLAQAGIELNPDEHDINALTDDELSTIRQNLAMIYQLRARDGWMETENFIANCKSSYSKILAVLNKYSNQKTESTVRTAGESKFVYADKNYIDTIFDGLDEDYKAFMQKEFLDYGEFTSDHSGDYEKMSMQLYSSLLRDLALSTSKPEWFRIAHFFVNKENGKNPAKYSDLTKDDLAEINRKMFWKEQGITKQGDKQYVWVHAPIYADKGQLHFYRVPIIELEAKNLDTDNPDETRPQILTEIVNLIKFETNRISNAKKRWKLIQDGKLEPIDCYDILKGKPGNAHKYCFQPMLNEYGVDENGKSVSLYDILAAEDSEEKREFIMEQAAAKIIANIIRQDCKQEVRGSDTEKKSIKKFNDKVDIWADSIENTLYENLKKYNKILTEIELYDYAKSIGKINKQKQWFKDIGIEDDENTTSIQVGERAIEKIQRSLTSYVRQADIFQLTISDVAFYKNIDDLQQRYALLLDRCGIYEKTDLKSCINNKSNNDDFLKHNDVSSPNMLLERFLNFKDIFRDKQKLSDEFERLMAKNPKYDMDIRQACKLKNDKFLVDLRNPAIRDNVVVLISTLIREHILSHYNSIKFFNSNSCEYLKKLIEEINPFTEQTMNLTEKQYLDLFENNMSANRLVGIYSNHLTAHTLVQGTELSLTSPIIIAEQQYSCFDDIKDHNGMEISRVLSELLSASLYNVKEHLLLRCWQNKNTASVTCFLLRLGVPLKTIIEMYKALRKAEPQYFARFMEYGPAGFREYACVYDANLGLGKKVKGCIYTKKDCIYNFYAMLGFYEKTIQNITTLNHLLMSDSTNGAIYDIVSIIEHIIKLKKLQTDPNLQGVSNVIPDFVEDKELFYKDKNEIMDLLENKVGKGKVKSYLVAYYLIWVNYQQFYHGIIDNGMIDECVYLGMQLPKFNVDAIKYFIVEYSKQQLRYLDMFAPRVESMKKNWKQLMELGLEEASKYRVITTSEIIKNTLEEIPKKLEEYKRKYKDNAFIQMLSRVQQKDGVFLMIKNIADMRAETVNEVKEAFNQLYSNISSYRDAMDLIRYTLCVNGFGYDPRSFVSMIPIKTLAKVKGIENVFEFFEIDKLDNFEDNFIIKNDLVDYNVEIPNKHGDVFFMPTKSKIIGKRMEIEYDTICYKKVYEAQDGAYYTLMNEREKFNCNYKVFEMYDKEIVSNWLGAITDDEGNFKYDSNDEVEIDEDEREEILESIVKSVMREASKQGRDLRFVSKEDAVKLLNSDNAIGRYL